MNLAFICWVFQQTKNTLNYPCRNVISGIFWLLEQHINMKFTTHQLHSKGHVCSVAFHPHFPLFAVGLQHNSAIIYDLTTPQPTIQFTLIDHLKWVLCVAFHPTYLLFATGSSDKSAFIYDISMNPPTINYHFKDHLGEINEIAFHPKLPIFATCSKILTKS